MKKKARFTFKLLTLLLLITISLWLLPLGSVYADELTDDSGQEELEEPPPEEAEGESDTEEETEGSCQDEDDADTEEDERHGPALPPQWCRQSPPRHYQAAASPGTHSERPEDLPAGGHHPDEPRDPE